MKVYYVYILLCADDSYYTGVTNDIKRRLEEHRSGLNSTSYTHGRRPVELVWYKRFNDINEAIRLEKQIKGWTRIKKQALINGDTESLVKYSKNYTEFGRQK